MDQDGGEAVSSRQHKYRGRIVRIIDGDTVEIVLDLGFYVEKRMRVRLRAIDAPEVRGDEREQGVSGDAVTPTQALNVYASTQLLAAFVFDTPEHLHGGRPCTVQSFKGRSFNRWNAFVTVEQPTDVEHVVDVVDLSWWMVKNGHAVSSEG